MSALEKPAAAAPIAPHSSSRQAQELAADPSACAWVSANAGSGKTYILVRRVLRCLLDGAPINSILCLTFTKAAAAEMSNRLLSALGDWSASNEVGLARELRGLLGRDATDAELTRARGLFGAALDAPGGLRIMTIHSFCDGVLRRFPLEGGLAPGFETLTDAAQRLARRQAVDAVIADALEKGRPDLREALRIVSHHAKEARVDELVGEMLARREKLAALCDAEAADFEALGRDLRLLLGAQAGDEPETLKAQMLEAASDALLRRAAAILKGSDKKTDRETAQKCLAALAASGDERLDALAELFLTRERTARKDVSFLTKGMREASPDMAEELGSARDGFARLEQRRVAARCAQASLALIRIGMEAIGRYERIKRDANAADYDDLIAGALRLFTRANASWILYQLDSALRHVLIDEAQDSNGRQWELTRRLTEEFFAGQGASAEPRTIFAVGDEKQSIFGFQGAEPRLFAEMGDFFRERAEQAGVEWRDVSLNLSFRTVEPVLQAVDKLCDGLQGLTAKPGAIRHVSNRAGEPGLVEIWPPEASDDHDEAEENEAEAARRPSAAERLAQRIAGLIRRWLDDGERLESAGRPIAPGDILILLRRRDPLARLMIGALHEQGVPVAGADRLAVGGHIAALDLIALGEWLTQPEDDLALACVLKSPFFGWNDDDLFQAAHGREGSLWTALRTLAPENALCAHAAAALERWRSWGPTVPPYDFFAGLLHRERFRARFLARLGPEAGDALDEFLSLAIAYEQRNAASLAGFLREMRLSRAEIKRDLDQGRDEVRVMTAHGAKGLEANIVFLPDACSATGGRQPAIFDIDLPRAGPAPVWVVAGAKALPAVDAAREAWKIAQSDEHKRLFYVAMTRARDRLYICGHAGRRGYDGSWHDLAWRALSDMPVERDAHSDAMRLRASAAAPPRPASAPQPAKSPVEPPFWLWRPSPFQDDPALTLRPSALSGEAEPSARRGHAPPEAALRGRAVHRLLEMLPDLPRSRRAQAAARYLAGAAPQLPAPERERIAARVIEILERPDFEPLWGADSRAEAAVSALVDPPGGGSPRLVSGRIDRLAVIGDEVLIVDFKTGAMPVEGPGMAAQPYAAQLALYRLALKKIFPGRRLRAAILWTQEPVLAPAAAEALDAAEAWLFSGGSLRT